MNATAELTDRELSAKGDKLFADLRAYLILEEQVKAAGMNIAEQLYDRRQEIRDALEAMPIHTEDVDARRPMGFIYTSGEWWPAKVCNDLGKWAEYRINYADGFSESGLKDRYEWAHCTADNTPNFHWLDRPEDEAIQLKRFEAYRKEQAP